jgi:midasin (ATPase involved in ribosome maturation)
MVSYRQVLTAMRKFSPILDIGKEKILHLLLAQHLASILGKGYVKINLSGRKDIDILVGNSVAIEVKRRLPSYRTLYRQLRMYRRIHRNKKIILYIYSGVDKIKRKELKMLKEKDVVDKIIINTTVIDYKLEKNRYIISPPRQKIIEIP